MADGFMVQEAGMFNYDSRNVYAKWVKDMIDTQEANGNVAGIAPDFPEVGFQLGGTALGCGHLHCALLSLSLYR